MLRKFNYGKGNKQVEQSKVLHSLRDVVSKKEEEWKMKGLLTKKMRNKSVESNSLKKKQTGIFE